MADKTITDLSNISSIDGDEFFYGIQADEDAKIVLDGLVDYVLNTYEFNQDSTNTNVLAGKIASLQALTNVADLADKTYPPGSLYWSSDSTSPASFFGGSWVRVKDRFALAAGSSYVVGSQGGNSVHLLTVSEIPTHNHGGVSGTPSDNTSGEPSTNSTGGNNTGHTHSIPSLSGSTTTDGGHSHTLTGRKQDQNGTSYSSGSPAICEYNASFATQWASPGDHKHNVTTTAKNSGNNNASHKHSMSHTHTLNDHTHSITAQGGGNQHNNMPPYVVKYCWERIE